MTGSDGCPKVYGTAPDSGSAFAVGAVPAICREATDASLNIGYVSQRTSASGMASDRS